MCPLKSESVDREHPPSCRLQSQGLCQQAAAALARDNGFSPATGHSSSWQSHNSCGPFPLPIPHSPRWTLPGGEWYLGVGILTWEYLPSHTREVQDRRKSDLQSIINSWKAEVTDSCQSINGIKQEFGCIWPPMGAQAKHLPARLLIKNGVFIKLRFGRRVRGGVTFPTKLSSSAGTAIIFITFWQPTRFTTAFH